MSTMLWPGLRLLAAIEAAGRDASPLGRLEVNQ